MSGELLVRLQAEHAFEAMPPRRHLADLHVPFDGLASGSESAGPWEATLDAALRRGERVAVVGRSGEGKSSLIQYALGPTVEGLAPLPVAVGIEVAKIVSDPPAFAEHFVRRVQGFVRDSMPQAALAPARRNTSLTVGAPFWLGLKAEVTHELNAVVEDAALSAADHVKTAVAVLSVIAQAGMTPVLVLDDTDKWTRTQSGDPDRTLRRAFFGPILRLVAEELGCSAAIAVHPQYRQDEAWAEAMTVIGTVVEVPRLRSSDALARVLAHREEIALRLEPGETDGWGESGVAALFEVYRDGHPLRRALTIAHASLAQAVIEGADHIDGDHVEWARRETEG